MSVDLILFILSFIILFLILFLDLYFYNIKHPKFLTNQNHINLYIIPFAISYSLFLLAISDDDSRAVFAIIILIMFAILYIFMIGQYKIILRAANINEVIDKLSQFLSSSGKDFKIYQVSDHLYDVEINNFSRSLVIRDKSKWVEIESNLHRDGDFLTNLDTFFVEESKKMKTIKLVPNIFFYLLIVFTIIIMLVLLGYMR